MDEDVLSLSVSANYILFPGQLTPLDREVKTRFILTKNGIYNYVVYNFSNEVIHDQVGHLDPELTDRLYMTIMRALRDDLQPDRELTYHCFTLTISSYQDDVSYCLPIHDYYINDEDLDYYLGDLLEINDFHVFTNWGALVN